MTINWKKATKPPEGDEYGCVNLIIYITVTCNIGMGYYSSNEDAYYDLIIKKYRHKKEVACWFYAGELFNTFPKEDELWQ